MTSANGVSECVDRRSRVEIYLALESDSLLGQRSTPTGRRNGRLPEQSGERQGVEGLRRPLPQLRSSVHAGMANDTRSKTRAAYVALLEGLESWEKTIYDLGWIPIRFDSFCIVVPVADLLNRGTFFILKVFWFLFRMRTAVKLTLTKKRIVHFLQFMTDMEVKSHLKQLHSFCVYCKYWKWCKCLEELCSASVEG